MPRFDQYTPPGAITGSETVVIAQGGNTRTINLAALNIQYLLANGGDASRNTVLLGTTALPLHALFDFDIRAFGARCDGITDDSPAIQRAHDEAVAAGGGTVKFPALPIAWNGQVVASGAAVWFVGAGWSETCSSGTRIIITSTAASILHVTGAAVRGGGIRNMSFQQDQPAPGSGWAPTPYPFVIDVFNTAGQWTVDELFFYNCYDCVCSVLSGRTNIGSLNGQPLHCLLYIDQSFDTTHIEKKVRPWPYWSSDPSVLAWTQANADVIRLFRTDGFQAPSLFSFGYRSGLRTSGHSGQGSWNAATNTPPLASGVGTNGFYYTVSTGGTTSLDGANAWAAGDIVLFTGNRWIKAAFLGTCNLAQIGAFYPDGSKYGLWNDPTGIGASMHIASIYTGGENILSMPIPGGFSVYMQSQGCTLSLGSAKLFYVGAEMIVMDQPAGGNVLMIGNLELNNFNQNFMTAPAPAIFSNNCRVPNIIRIANQPNVVMSNGASLINNCNAWFTCPGDTPLIIVNPASGSTVTLGIANKMTVIEPAGTLAALTIALPPTFEPNAEITVLSAQAITTLTVTAGPTVIVAPAAQLVAGEARKFKYFDGSITAEGVNAWFGM